MKIQKFMLVAFMLIMLLAGGVFAETYGPGVWIQKGYDTEAFEHQTGPLSGTAIVGVFPSTVTNPAAFLQNIAGDLYLIDNAYYDGSAWQGNITTKKVLALAMDATNGTFKFNYAAAGTTPSFSTVASIDSTGAMSMAALTLTGNLSVEGNTDLGNAATDTISLTGVVDTDLAFVKEVARTIKIADTTTAATAGAALTVQAGYGTTDGGNLVLRAGDCAAGTDGVVQLGITNTSAITIGASGITTTNAGALTVTEALTANGNVDLGNAAADTISLTGVVDTDQVFVKEVARTIQVATSTTTDTSGAALTIEAGDGVGAGGGGNLVLRAGNAGAGTDGILQLGVTDTSAISIGATGITTTNAGAFTSTQTLTASGAFSAEGDVDLGNAATDTISATGVVDTDLTFIKEVARVIKVDTSTTADTAGAALTVQAGAGLGTGNGGALSLNAGAKGAGGADGALNLGTANTSAISIGASSITATSNGPLTVTEALTANGNVDLGNAGTDTVSVTGTIDTDLTFALEVNRTISVATSTTADTAGANLSLVAAQGLGTGIGGAFASAGGQGGATAAGGTAALTGGAGGATSGDGGAASVTGGAATNGGSNGGAASINGGAKNGGGTNGVVNVGTVTTSQVEIAASTIDTSVNGSLTVDEKVTANGDTDIGNAATDTLTITSQIDSDIAFVKEVNRTIAPAASTTTNADGADVTINGGAKDGAGTDGQVNLGSANTSAINLGADAKLADAKAIVYGTGADINVEYEGTDNVLDESLGAAAHSTNINLTSTATCTEGMAITVNSSTIADAAADAKDAMGICRVGVVGVGTATVAIQGTVPATTDAYIDINRPLKACTGGRVGEAIDSTNASRTISSTTGGDFANQPANDSITLVSDNAGDTQNVTLYGTTNGTDTVVTEVIALTGAAPVTTTKVDWGELLGVELDSQAVGTITIKETSGGLTITTLVATNESKGVFTVVTTSGANRAFNAIPFIVADAATSKQMGVVGTAVDYSALTNNSKNLNDTTAVPLATAMNTVTKLLVGDVEAARTVYLKVRAAEDDTELILGRSLEAATAKDQTKRILLEKGK